MLKKSYQTSFVRHVVDLYAQGKSPKEILGIVAAEGHKNTEGGELTESSIFGILHRFRKRAVRARSSKRKVVAEGTGAYVKAPTTGLPNTVLGILTDPTLSDAQKVRMIGAYANEAA